MSKLDDGNETQPTEVSHRPRPLAPWKAPVGISGVTIFVLGGGLLLMNRAESAVNGVALGDEPKSVTVAVAREASFRPTRRYVGTLEPWQQARVGPQLASGYVDTVLVRPGAVVKRGTVLATLDCRNASSANLAVAAQARAVEARQRAATREAARLGELLDGGFVSPNEVEQKQAQAAANEAQIEALMAQAAGRKLEVSDCVLRAPFDGVVAARLADPGTFVRPGSAIVYLVDRSIVRLSGDVPEVDFDAVAPKASVELKFLATGRVTTAEIARRAPAADPATRTVHFEIDVPNDRRDMPVGTTAEIRVEVGTAARAVEIPLLAAKVKGKTAHVFVVEGDVARQLSVPVLGERGGSLFVGPSLAPGAQVVTQGRSLLSNNDQVTARVEAPPADAGGDAKP